ncbi:MAG: GIY-YIG nuclease family protein [bacterium]|nr:GIY-YIG nuclease family protein [bacterium]
MKYYVYILINLDNKIYIGQTSDIKKRFIEHNESGKGYTSKFRPWRLIDKAIFNTRADAMKRERYLKTGVGRDWIKKQAMGV